MSAAHEHHGGQGRNSTDFSGLLQAHFLQVAVSGGGIAGFSGGIGNVLTGNAATH